jgi:transketolase
MNRHLDEKQISELEIIAYRIRRLCIEMICYARWGHIGGSLSLAELLSVLYFHHMELDPNLPEWNERDRLILSKAHAAPALYASLALRGYFPPDQIYSYCQLGSILEGHTDMRRTPGVEASGGPLGLGLSIAVGLALGLRLKESSRPRVFCIIGDGESNEGNIWEAAMAAAHYGLDNLIAIMDYNKVMAKGFVDRLMSIEPIAEKWRAFGWDVLEIDGHDIEAIASALYQARWVRNHGSPIVIIANTVKGRGVKMAEFNYKWHTHPPDPETANKMLIDLAREYGQPEEGYSRLNEPVVKETFYGGE